MSYRWEGNLASQETDTVRLPALVSAKAGEREFVVSLGSPNGSTDDFPDDNSGSSTVIMPPTYAPEFVLALRSNHDSTNNGYQIIDQTGSVVRERKPGTLSANSSYYDTLHLASGCYRLVVVDTAGDGLDFWANPEGGYGYVRLLDLSGHLIKAFGSDFGSEIDYSFMVAENARMPLSSDSLPLANPFPARNKGLFTVEVFQNEPSDLTLKVVGPDTAKVVFEQSYPHFKEGFLPIDITAQPDTTYYLKATSNGQTITRRIKLKHKD